MFRRIRPITLAVLLLCLLLPATPGAAAPRKLNGPLAPGGGVSTLAVSPAGDRVVYLANQLSAATVELFSAPLNAGEPVRLNAPLVFDGNVTAFAISPDSAQVVYLADQNAVGRFELFVVPIDGGPPLRLNSTLVAGGRVHSFQISPDGRTVIYRAEQNALGRVDLFSAPIGGGGTVRLNPELPTGGAVLDAQISADSQRVVYRLARSAAEGVALLSSPINGGAPLNLSEPYVASASGRTVSTFQISPDSSRVVYRADWAIAGVPALRSVLIGGGGDVTLHPPPLSGADADFQISAGPTPQVVFSADLPPAPTPEAAQVADTTTHLFSVALDGAAEPRLLSAGAATGQPIRRFAVTAAGQTVVFQLDTPAGTLFSTPIDATTPPQQLTPDTPGTALPSSVARHLSSQPGATLQVNDFQLSDDSRRVIYRAAPFGGLDELFSLPLAPGAAAERLNRPLPPEGSVQAFLVAPGSAHVVYIADQDVAGVHTLYSVLIGGGAPTRLNGPLADGGAVRDFQFSPDGDTVIYRADQALAGLVQIHAVPTVGGADRQVSASQAIGGDVLGVQVSADSRYAVYLAAQDQPERNEIYAADLLTPSAPIKLNAPLGPNEQILDLQISPDGGTVVYRLNRTTTRVIDLYAVPIDGGAAVRLSAPLPANSGVFDFSFSPDGATVVYRADQLISGVPELFSVPIGGGGSIRLNPPLPPGGLVRSQYAIDPDGSRVIFLAQQDSPSVTELFSVPIGGGAPIRLSRTLPEGGAVRNFRLTGAATVVYLADQNSPGVTELYAVGVLGGDPRRLNPPLSAPYFVSDDYAISPDGTRVVYLAQQESAGVTELFSVPIGGGPAARLNAPPGADGDVFAFRISPNPAVARVVYQADQDTDGITEIYSAPLDGSADPVRLNAPFGPGGGVAFLAFAVSPDGERVVFQARESVQSSFNLFSAAIAGGDPVRLNGNLAAGAAAFGFQITPDSRQVVYIAPERSPDQSELFRVGITGGPTLRINGPLVRGGNVLSVHVLPDGSGVVYRADQERNTVVELFRADLTDAQASIAFAGDLPTEVREDAGSLELELELSAEVSRPVTLTLVAGGSARFGEDYTFRPVTLTIPPGATRTSVTLTLIDDLEPEGPETLTLTIAVVEGAAIGEPSTITLIIIDDDATDQLFLPLLQ
jgi:Tol biopolymer transport system component